MYILENIKQLVNCIHVATNRPGLETGERNEIFVIWYTYGLYRQLVPDGSFKDWEKSMHPGQFGIFLKEAIDMITQNVKRYRSGKNLGELDIRLVAMDERYLEWLESMDIRDSAMSRYRYAKEHGGSEETITILKKERNDTDIAICYFLVRNIGKADGSIRETAFQMDDKAAESLKEILEKTYPEGSVYVPGYIFAMMYTEYGYIPTNNRILERDFKKSAEVQLRNLADTYFRENGLRARIHRFDTQERKSGIKNVDYCLIPFAVRQQITEPVWRADECMVEKSKLCFFQNADTIAETISSAFPGRYVCNNFWLLHNGSVSTMDGRKISGNV